MFLRLYCIYANRVQQNLNLLTHWQVNGAHYGLTSEAWLQNMDKNEKELLPILGDICAPTLPVPFVYLSVGAACVQSYAI